MNHTSFVERLHEVKKGGITEVLATMCSYIAS